MRNLVGFELHLSDGKKSIEYFDWDDIYDVLDFSVINIKDGRKMIGIIFGNKPYCYLWPYSENNMNTLYKFMQAIESITENADGKTITVKYKSFTVKKDIKCRGYYEALKKEQLKRGNFGCDEITRANFEEFGEYGEKSPKSFVGAFSEILYLELLMEVGKPIIVVHFKDRLGYAPYSELVFAVLASKMKKIKSMDFNEKRSNSSFIITYEDGTKYIPSNNSTKRVFLNPTSLFSEQASTTHYCYMDVFGNKKTEETEGCYGPMDRDYDSHFLDIDYTVRAKGIIFSFPVGVTQHTPIIGQKRGYFYYDVITDERIQRGIIRDNDRKVLFFGGLPSVSGREVAEVLRKLSPDDIARYREALSDLKMVEIPGVYSYMDIGENKSLRYEKYKETLEEKRIEEKRREAQRAEAASGAKIKEFRDKQGLHGSR